MIILASLLTAAELVCFTSSCVTGFKFQQINPPAKHKCVIESDVEPLKREFRSFFFLCVTSIRATASFLQTPVWVCKALLEKAAQEMFSVRGNDDARVLNYAQITAFTS